MAEQQAKIDAENAVKEQQKQVGVNYRNKVKELIELCASKLQGTKFDKFWVQSITKRYTMIEKIAPICEYLQTCESADAFSEFIAQYMMSQDERVKI